MRRRARRALGRRPLDRADVAWHQRPDDLAPFSRAHAEGNAAPVRLLGRLERGRRRHLDVGGHRASASPSGCGSRPTSARSTRRSRRRCARNDLVTVCEEAGCPNIYECWNDGTATFMINGVALHAGVRVLPRRHAQAAPLDARRAAPGRRRPSLEARPRARRDHQRRPRRPRRRRGRRRSRQRRRDPRAVARHARRGADPRLQGRRRRRSTLIFDARPDVLNHNLETVARLQRAVRPSAGYARSLARAGARQGRRPHHQVGAHGGPGRDATTK